MGMETISPSEAVSYIGENRTLFIDLREREDYLKGHIPGAIHMDYEELMQKKQELLRYQTVVLYCDRGNSSLLAARELRKLPVEIKSIAYGMAGYHGPVTKGQRKRF